MNNYKILNFIYQYTVNITTKQLRTVYKAIFYFNTFHKQLYV